MISSQTTKITRWCSLLSLGIVLSACLGTNGPEPRYYSLLSIDQLGVATASQVDTQLRIGIGPISVPDALTRSQIVTRDAQNLYQFSEFNRWVGTFEQDVAYVLGKNLVDLLGAEQIAFFPWLPHFSPTFRFTANIIQLDGNLDGEALLSVHWVIADADGRNTLASGNEVYRQPVDGGDYPGLVEAESRLLAEFSRDIAEALTALAPRG